MGEVGGAIATSANGSKWFKEWNVDVSVGRPAKLQSLRMRKWETGEEVKVVDLSGYEDQWGVVSFQCKVIQITPRSVYHESLEFDID